MENNNLLTALYRHYLIMKTFHFQTELAFRHTKVDTYLQSYLTNMDKLMEVIQGADGTVSIGRIAVVTEAANDDNISAELQQMVGVLEIERKRGQMISAIIDQMQADIYQLSYLFTFK